VFQPDVASATAFTWGWQWQTPIVAVLAVIELAYIVMWYTCGIRARGAHLSWARLATFTAGVVAIVVADLSPIGANDEKFLSMHMLGHDIFIWIAAPLMVLGLLPLLEPTERLPKIVRVPVTYLTYPLGAWVISTALLWFWHFPANYDRALSSNAIHALEHACFLIAYVIYWWPLIAPPSVIGGLHTNAGRAGYLVAGAMQSALLGALIMFHGSVLYSHYMNFSGSTGSPPLADQHLAGAIMLFPGAVVFTVAAALLIQTESRPSSAHDRVATGGQGAGGLETH
jgi:putative membrane protein